MNAKRKIVFWSCGMISLFLIILIISAILFFYFSMNRLYWPRIRNPENLISECHKLIQDHKAGRLVLEEAPRSLGSVVREAWPGPIKELHPRAVYLNEDSIIILTSTGGIGSSVGYIIFDPTSERFQSYGKKKAKQNGRYVWATRFPHIYKWENIE